jgi:hypothetical protein
MRNGSSDWSRCNAWKTVSWRLSRSPAQTTQPVATSTMLSVYRNGPAPLQPQWATRSISTNPGRASVQSANVRIAICRFSSVPALVVLMPCRALVCSRSGLSARSIVAALIRATCVWTATRKSRSAWRRRNRSSSSRRNGARRLEQMPSVTSQHSRSNSTSAGP